MADTSAKTKMILPFFQTKRATAVSIFVVAVVLGIGAALFWFFSRNNNENKAATAEVATTKTSAQAPADIRTDVAILIQKYPIILSDRCLSRLFGVNKQYTERYDGDVDVLECPNLIPSILRNNGIPGEAVGASMAMEFCLGLKQLDEDIGDLCRKQVLTVGYTADYGEGSLPPEVAQATSGV